MSDWRAEPPPSPPTPPPLPPKSSQDDAHFKTASLKLKVRSAEPGWLCQSPNPPPPVAPTGAYFFYGTLMDPRILAEVLVMSSEIKPDLRPARIVGYSCKLWGQYPALVGGPSEGIVEGVVYNVETVEDGGKLAAYETRNYAVKQCLVAYTDGKEPETVSANVFVFAGDPRELSEGEFDLKLWLRRMGRGEAVD